MRVGQRRSGVLWVHLLAVGQDEVRLRREISILAIASGLNKI